jgi:hypothetical protein
MRDGITFAVDAVNPVREPLDAIAPLSGRMLASSLRAGEGVRACRTHPLVEAVHVAFSEHRPLLLTPDAVWLTLAQGFAIHVGENADSLRGRFVRHDGKQVLEVTVAASFAFPDVFERFAELLAEQVGPGVVRLMTCDFSTSGPVERAVSRIVLMKAFEPYFDYQMNVVCGIPEIRLAGTTRDWREIRRRVEVLGEWDLQWWTASVLPVIDQMIVTSDGKPDVDFWQCIHMPREVYGGELVTGWLPRLFPYLTAGGRYRRNPIVLSSGGKGRAAWQHAGTALGTFPVGLSVARVREKGAGSERSLDVGGGFLGLAQDARRFVFPRIGWTVRIKGFDDLWGRLRRSHPTVPPSGPQLGDGVPEVLRAFYEQFGGAVLQDGEVTMRPSGQLEALWLPGGRRGVRFADERDGAFLAYCAVGEPHVVRVAGQPPSEHTVATSLLEWFERVLPG